MTVLTDPQISALIIHRIPSKKETNAGPELSETTGTHQRGVVEYCANGRASIA